MKNMLLIFIAIVCIGLLFYSSKKTYENFSNSTLGVEGSKDNDVLIPDIFPITGINSVSDKQASRVWWQYPIFKVGSFAQITNNIRYPRNADTGRCMPEDFCDAIYLPRENKSNYVTQLPPVNPDCGTRIGYFTTDQNLLPFRTDTPNILY